MYRYACMFVRHVGRDRYPNSPRLRSVKISTPVCDADRIGLIPIEGRPLRLIVNHPFPTRKSCERNT